jgi:hypothetical protein
MRGDPDMATDHNQDRTRVVLMRQPAGHESAHQSWSQQTGPTSSWTESERLVAALKYSTIILASVTIAAIFLFLTLR